MSNELERTRTSPLSEADATGNTDGTVTVNTDAADAAEAEARIRAELEAQRASYSSIHPEPDPSLRLDEGSTFARDFRVVEPLAEGAHGALYIVEQLSTKARRALKVLQPALVESEELRERFEREAYVASSIDSEHVVHVITAGVDGDSGMPWLVTELLKGEDLRSYTRARGRLSSDETYFILRQVLHALGAAHAAKVVHRDLKPENVFLARVSRDDARFTVKVLDFGIAEVLTGGNDTQTQMGTPLWMAPEQWTPGTPPTPATDVWAVGLVAFYLLVGQEYWLAARDRGTPTELMREVLIDEYPDASTRARELGRSMLFPDGFNEWFARCVSRRPEQRFADGLMAKDALERVLDPDKRGRPTMHPHVSPAPPSVGRLHRLKALARSVPDDPAERERTFSVALAMALADGELAEAETELIEQLAEWFAIPPGRAATLLEEFQKDD